MKKGYLAEVLITLFLAIIDADCRNFGYCELLRPLQMVYDLQKTPVCNVSGYKDQLEFLLTRVP